MEGGHERKRIARGWCIERHDAGERSTPRLDQPLIFQPLQRLADGRAAYPQLRRDLLIAHPFSRLQFATDNSAQKQVIDAGA